MLSAPVNMHRLVAGCRLAGRGGSEGEWCLGLQEGIKVILLRMGGASDVQHQTVAPNALSCFGYVTSCRHRLRAPTKYFKASEDYG
jgi:hypothetical protein